MWRFIEIVSPTVVRESVRGSRKNVLLASTHGMAALVRRKFRFIEAERGTGFPPKMTWSAKSKDSQVKATLKKKLKFE